MWKNLPHPPFPDSDQMGASLQLLELISPWCLANMALSRDLGDTAALGVPSPVSWGVWGAGVLVGTVFQLCCRPRALCWMEKP